MGSQSLLLPVLSTSFLPSVPVCFERGSEEFPGENLRGKIGPWVSTGCVPRVRFVLRGSIVGMLVIRIEFTLLLQINFIDFLIFRDV